MKSGEVFIITISVLLNRKVTQQRSNAVTNNEWPSNEEASTYTIDKNSTG